MRKLNKKSAKNLVILAKITIKWHVAVCEAQGSLKGPKLMIKGIKEAQGRLREAQGTEKALKGTTSVLEAGLTPTTSLMWKFIHSALGAYTNTNTSILTSCSSTLGLKPPTVPSNCFYLGPPHVLSTNDRVSIGVLFPLEPCERMLFLQPKASLPKLCLVRPLELLIPICLE